MDKTITYKIEDRLYINLTNRCSNSCTFCVRNTNDGVDGYYLWLGDYEPTAQEIIESAGDLTGIRELVFCGFGEPLYRLETVIQVAEYAHAHGVLTRLNTNGQASLITGRADTAERLRGVLDSVNISLNNVDADSYQEVCRSIFGAKAFEDMLQFARDCVGVIPDVALSVVDVIGEDNIAKARVIAESVGARLRVRAYIE